VTPRDDISNEGETTPRLPDEPPAQPTGEGAGRSEPPTDPVELREQIAATREDLGATVQALADKSDVKAQAREKVDERKQQAAQAAEQAVEQVRSRPVPFALVGAFIAGGVIGLILRRRR
jgi:hypothetical protein